MAHWKTESALAQALADLAALNEQDRQVISAATRRIEGRARLRKIIRRHFKRQGLVDISLGDTSRPMFVSKDQLR